MSDNDTTTELNPGTGGDLMDESLVTQADGTQAKRPRVVPGNDDGDLFGSKSDIHGKVVQVVALDPHSVDLLERIADSQEKIIEFLDFICTRISRG